LKRKGRTGAKSKEKRGAQQKVGREKMKGKKQKPVLF